MAGLSMQGLLFKYGKKPQNLAFKFGSHTKNLILVEGLTEGLLTLSYTKPLAETLDEMGWSLVKAQITSSCMGFGFSDITQDAREIQDLVKYMIENQNCESYVLMGHSTGCQDSVRYVKLFGDSSEVSQLKGVILQGGVSDREFMMEIEEYVKILPEAQKAVAEGRGEEVIFRPVDYDRYPITAKRMVSFLERGGDDDMFSSDFSDEELNALLGHMNRFPTLIIQSTADEYIPKRVNAAELAQRFQKSIGDKAQLVVVEDGNHALKGKEDELAQIVKQFVNQLQ
eukprot:TRINITY_DN6822_c0_g1_i2.p1 TRINITY_DN6822_c0_g1~~TRINITY_DN6822_c0_g1_i2.p1  ORF type:complete len:326 (-),score=52.51 TRINITY_DN6822_c0_g1_i2:503-1354(-)